MYISISSYTELVGEESSCSDFPLIQIPPKQNLPTQNSPNRNVATRMCPILDCLIQNLPLHSFRNSNRPLHTFPTQNLPILIYIYIYFSKALEYATDGVRLLVLMCKNG